MQNQRGGDQKRAPQRPGSPTDSATGSAARRRYDTSRWYPRYRQQFPQDDSQAQPTSYNGQGYPALADAQRSQPGRFGQKQGERSRRAGRRWPWLYRTGATAPSPGSAYLRNIQSCLAQVVGPWVPQDGVLGPRTRVAVKTFQALQDMPESGVLDRETVSAIRAACSGEPAPPVGRAQTADSGEPDVTGSPDGGAASDAGGPDSSAAPDTGSPDQGGGSDAAPAEGAPGGDTGAESDFPGELSFSELERDQEQEQQQEFVLTGPASVEAKTMPRAPLTEALTGLAEGPGVYIIYVNDRPWYVGVAEDGIRKRFLSRLKVLREFNVPLTVLQGRSVESIALVRGTVGKQALSRRSMASVAATPLTGSTAILKVLEQVYIRKMRTGNKGNRTQERVYIDNKGGSLAVSVDGKALRLPLQPYQSESGQAVAQVL